MDLSWILMIIIGTLIVIEMVEKGPPLIKAPIFCELIELGLAGNGDPIDCLGIVFS